VIYFVSLKDERNSRQRKSVERDQCIDAIAESVQPSELV